MIEITIPIKYNMPRDEWAVIRAQLLVLGCPSKAVPKRYATLKHRLRIIEYNTMVTFRGDDIAHVRISQTYGQMAAWLSENNLAVTHKPWPSRYVIFNWGEACQRSS